MRSRPIGQLRPANASRAGMCLPAGASASLPSSQGLNSVHTPKGHSSASALRGGANTFWFPGRRPS